MAMAMANDGLTFQLTYLYLTQPLVVDVNLLYGRLEAKAVHPVYGQVVDATRYGAALSVFNDLFKKPGWRAYASVEYLQEDGNVDFFDSRVSSLTLGVIWRKARK